MKGNKKPVLSSAAKIITPKSDNPTDPVVNPDFVEPDKKAPVLKPLIDPNVEKATETPETAPEPSIVRGFRQIKRLNKWDLAVIALVLVLIAGFGVYASTTSTSPLVKVATNDTKSSPGSHPFKSTSCSTKSCLTASFAKCTAASYYSNTASAKIRYQIYGQAAGGCVMYYQYAWSPNPTWVGESMTCNFDNTTSLDNSVAEVFSDLSAAKNTFQCTGPLVPLLQAG
jgi:hypothetical protein